MSIGLTAIDFLQQNTKPLFNNDTNLGKHTSLID